MITTIDDPLATAWLRWLTPEQGGRRTGPPAGPVYLATCVREADAMRADARTVTAAEELLSIVIERVGQAGADEWTCRIDFLARRLAGPVLAGRSLVVTEGPRVVARGHIVERLDRPCTRGR